MSSPCRLFFNPITTGRIVPKRRVFAEQSAYQRCRRPQPHARLVHSGEQGLAFGVNEIDLFQIDGRCPGL